MKHVHSLAPLMVIALLASCAVAHAEERPALDGEPAPAGPPTREAWAAAPLAKGASVRVTDPGCSVKQIGEWVRVECRFASFERISGPANEATFGCNGDGGWWGCDTASVTFPIRRGQRVAFQSFRGTKWGPVADSVISAQFLPGDAAPLISVQGIRGGV